MKKVLTLVVTLVIFGIVSTTFAAERYKTITIIERPGYFETQGDVFDIGTGKYKFVVINKSGKDAGFVFNKGQNNITTDKTSLKVILLKNGEQGSFTLTLSEGNYTYFCPIIPTPPYPIRVK